MEGTSFFYSAGTTFWETDLNWELVSLCGAGAYFLAIGTNYVDTSVDFYGGLPYLAALSRFGSSFSLDIALTSGVFTGYLAGMLAGTVCCFSKSVWKRFLIWVFWIIGLASGLGRSVLLSKAMVDLIGVVPANCLTGDASAIEILLGDSSPLFFNLYWGFWGERGCFWGLYGCETDLSLSSLLFTVYRVSFLIGSASAKLLPWCFIFYPEILIKLSSGFLGVLLLTEE